MPTERPPQRRLPRHPPNGVEPSAPSEIGVRLGEPAKSVWSGPTIIALLALVSIFLHLILRYFFGVPKIAWQVPLIVAVIAGGFPLVVQLMRKTFTLQFGSDHLAGISIVTSVILGEYLVGVIVILMLSGGTALEEFASSRASSVLDALAKRMPQVAHRKTGRIYPMSNLQISRSGTYLLVFPHEICPVDGVVVEGRGKMNEAYLTGEPFEIEKAPGAQVLSGAVNGDVALHIRAEKLAVDSRYARIMRVMQDAEQRRPRIRRLGDKLGAWYTPTALALAALAWAITGESHRFLAVIVVATPCPLLIAIPVAVIGAISLAARRGIIIKNPAVLEQIDRCRTLIFDKTGTLTYGRPPCPRSCVLRDLRKRKFCRQSGVLSATQNIRFLEQIQEAVRNAHLPLRTCFGNQRTSRRRAKRNCG